MTEYFLESLLLITIFISGYSFARLSPVSKSTLLKFCTSYFLGILNWVFVFHVTSVAFTPFNYFIGYSKNWQLLLFVIFAISITYFSFNSKRQAPYEWKYVINASFIVSGINVITNYFPLLILTGDSFHMLEVSGDLLKEWNLGFPRFSSAFQTINLFSNFEFNPGFFLTGAVMLLIGVYGSVQTLLDNQKLSIFARHTFSLAAVLLVILSPMMLSQAIFINHHIIVAGLLLIASMNIIQRAEGFNPSNFALFISTYSLLGVCLARVEGILTSLLYAAACYPILNKLERRFYYKCFFLVLAPWNLYLMFSFWDGGFVSGKQFAIFLIAMMLLVGLAYIPSKFAFLGFFNCHFRTIVLVFFVSSIAVLYFLEFDHMLTSHIFFFKNLGMKAEWGSFWIFAILALFSVFVVDRSFDDKLQILIFFPVLHIISLLIVVALRAPYRVGFVDSANRMLVHIVPMIVIGIIWGLRRKTSAENI